MHLNFYKYCTVRISYCRIHYIRLQLAKRNSSLHLILYESSLRLIQFFSILSFRIWSLLSRIFFPTSYFCLLKKLILADLSLSAIWKLRYINSSSHRSFLSNLYSIRACLYMHIFSGSARFAWAWISVCVRRCTFPLGIHSLHAFADASLMFFFNFSWSPGMCHIKCSLDLECPCSLPSFGQ